MDPTTLKKMLLPILGTIFAVVTGLLALLVVLRTLEYFNVGMSPLLFFVLGILGALVCSLYTSMCVRIELDLVVVLLGASFGSLFLFVIPQRTFDVAAVLWVLLASSFANSVLGTLITERFRWIGEGFIETAHMVQLVFLMAAIVWSFSDMTVRAALAVYGLIAVVGWQPLFLGTCALTLIEAKLDIEGRKAELVERGFILYYLEKKIRRPRFSEDARSVVGPAWAMTWR